jgi:hypothetical protein
MDGVRAVVLVEDGEGVIHGIASHVGEYIQDSDFEGASRYENRAPSYGFCFVR